METPSEFYATWRWWALRHFILCIYGRRCRKCWGYDNTAFDPLQVDHVYARARGPKGKHLQWKWWNLQPMHRHENLDKGTRFEDFRYAWVQRWFPIEDKPY